MDIISELKKHSSKEKAAIYRRFFKTGKGQYGEGDVFLGLTMPEIRTISANYNLSLDEIHELLKSKYHEVRMAAIINLTNQYMKNPLNKFVDFYLNNTDGINNWDLVDVTCHKVLGAHILKNESYRKKLYELSESKNLWEQRISVVSAFTLIRNNQFEDILKLSEKFLTHKHDLMHKAVGWMLREVGKKDEKTLRKFLDQHSKVMPRTMLRYSIEKFSKEDRMHYMKK